MPFPFAFLCKPLFKKDPRQLTTKKINNDFIKQIYQTLKKRKCKYANYKGQERYSELPGNEAKKGKHNWWFYHNRNARSRGDQNFGWHKI